MRKRRGDRVHSPRVDPDKADRVDVFRRGADGSADHRMVEEDLNSAEERRRDDQGERGELADRDVVGQRPAVIGEIADIGSKRPGVGAKALKQQIVDDHRQAKGGENRHEQPATRAPLQDDPLQREADDGHCGDDDHEAEEGIEAQPVREHEERVGRKHR